MLMHHSRLCAVLIDCKTADVDEAARFWTAALGRPVDRGHPRNILAPPPPARLSDRHSADRALTPACASRFHAAAPQFG
jgi:hypothetical protein